MADADCDDTVDPIVFRRAGLEHRSHAEIIARRVDGLALIEFFDDAWWTSAQAGDTSSTISAPSVVLEHKPHIEFHTRIGAYGLPVVAADYFARQPLALE